MVKSYNLKQFTDGFSKDTKETDIEAKMNAKLMEIMEDNIELFDKPTLGNSIPDAYAMLYNDEGKFVGHGIIEAKRFIVHDSKDYKKQVIQVLAYNRMYTKKHHNDFLIVYSANYMDFILLKENKRLINSYKKDIDHGLEEESPCNLYKVIDIDIDRLIMHRYEFKDGVDLATIMQDLLNALD